MDKEPVALEKEAHEFLSQGRAEEAYCSFKKAGDMHKANSSHKSAALCLASAASCWAIKSGEKMFNNSAVAYEEAAGEAELAGDLEYASLLYRQAAINFERDMEFFNFSDCFYRSRECLRRFLSRTLIGPQKSEGFNTCCIKKGERYGLIKRLALFIGLTFSALIWGHGERPTRTFFAALGLILVSAALYAQLNLAADARVFKPNFFQALYFSVVTFTTVGYGDITAVGAAKAVAMLEVTCGIFVVPIFIVGLSRRYLRT